MISNDTTFSHRELRLFAFCGVNEVFQTHLDSLAKLAEPETWTYRVEDPLHVLRHYVYDTFDKSKADNKILYTETAAAFNTGLLTNNGEDIIALFEINTKPNSQKWFLKGFFESSSWTFLKEFNEVPPLVSYHKEYDDYYFNPDLNIHINLNHILQDNKSRLSDTLSIDDDGTLLMMLRGAWELTLPKIKRNMRLVIPQYYKGKISYLVPIIFNVNSSEVTMAMAVEKLPNNQYRANTIFTLEMAYAQARLLMKPEADWIIKK